MDTQRLILFVIFAFSAIFLWEAWQREHQPPPVPVTAAPSAANSAVPAMPAPLPGAPHPPAGPTADAAPAGQRITVRTDVLSAQINTTGGVIEHLALVGHADSSDRSQAYELLANDPGHIAVAQSGLLGEGMPNHRTLWEALPGPRELAPGVDTLELRLKAAAPSGAVVVAIYTFRRNSYVIDVAYQITNTSSAPLAPYAYYQFTRDTTHPGDQSSMVPSAYTGPVLYNEADKFKKLEYADIDKLAADPSRKLPYTKATDNGWLGIVEHYFVAAWLPSDAAKTQREFYTRKLDNGLYAAGLIVPVGTIATGATGEIKVPLYAGPQEQDVLAGLAKGLDLVVDYGVFTVIAAPLFWLLKWLNLHIHNWGWSIIVLTILIKGVFYPLNHASARSMAKMKVIGPKLKALQEQYANDKQQLQVKMMELYRQEKINPLGGCLPIVVQIPVFIALYWVLLSAVELRHAPWIGWIQDLSAPDPWYVLPVLYAVSAYLQVKLSPTPISDPMQAKIMQIMPIAFSVMFIFFPSGLVLYWLINNLIQIGQQWHMNVLLTKEAAQAAARRR